MRQLDITKQVDNFLDKLPGKFDSKVVYIMTAGNRNDDDVYKKHGKKK
jgi:mRNA-degrading endonuclease RelE of RelBE toxin-antitoxin system